MRFTEIRGAEHAVLAEPLLILAEVAREQGRPVAAVEFSRSALTRLIVEAGLLL